MRKINNTMTTKKCKVCESEISKNECKGRVCRKCNNEIEKKRRKIKKEKETEEEKILRIEKHRIYYRERMSNPELRERKKQQQYENCVNNPVRHLFNRAKARAIKKGLEFTITQDDIIIPKTCPVFGVLLVPSNRTNNDPDNSPSLDRVDSSKGYTKDNIMVISYRANTLKNNATPEEIKMLYNFYCRPIEES